MVLNTFKVKRYAAFSIGGFIPVLFFWVGLNFFGLLISIILMFVGMLLSVLVGSLLLRNPFTAMLEGKGILALNVDSTGVIRPFIVALHQPYVKGKLGEETVNDVFDADSVSRIAQPIKAGKATKIKDGEGGINIELTEDDFNRSRFGLFQYPVIIYNNQLKSTVTKDFLSNLEKQAFAEHGVLYLNRKMEELTGFMRDFGRHIVELTKPTQSLWENKWVRYAMLFGLVIIVLLFAKPLWTAITGGAGASSLLSGLSSSAPVIAQ